ncbi:Hypothetical predicted protein, partial [Paramuricea clavata]
MMEKNQLKRKRTKLRCLVCQQTFDDDYRKEHNKKYHANLLKVGTSIAYETVGAPANPFVCSQKHKKVSTESVVTGVLKAGPSHVTEDNEESSQNTQGPSHLTISVNSENPELVCTVQEEDVQHEDENTPPHGNEEVEEQRTMPENQEIGEKESEELQ